jgi:putative peptidoglycan lipid II flippase
LGGGYGGFLSGRSTRATLTLAVLLTVSRLVGFVRSQAMAALFGATGETDAFVVAVSVSSLVTAVTGPVTVTFLPVYAALAAKGDPQSARKVASQVITLVSSFMMGASTVLAAFAPQVTRLIAPGFAAHTYANAVALTRVMLASMVLPLLASFAKSILNTRGQFAVPAVADIIENLIVVLALVLLAPALGVVSLGIAVAAGFLVLFLIQYFCLTRSGSWPPMEIGFCRETRAVLRLALPLMASSAFHGLHRFVDKALASRLAEGTMAVLEYADRIRWLPVGVLVAAVTTVMAPSLSGMWGRRDKRGFAHAVEANMRGIMFVCLPFATGLMVLAKPIVRLAFQRGAFTPGAAQATASALIAYAPGMVATAAVRVLTTAWVSSQKTGLTLVIGIWSSLLNVVLDYALVGPLGYIGLALASTVSGFLTLLGAAWYLGRDRERSLNLSSLVPPIGKMVAASTVMAAVALRLSDIMGLNKVPGTAAHDLMLLACVSGVSVAVYLTITGVLGCEEARRFLRHLTDRI